MSFHLHLDTEQILRVPPGVPIFVEPAATTRDVMREMKSGRQGSVLICEERKLLGIFTERDALRLMAVGVDLDLPIEKCMTANPVAVRTTDTVGNAIRLMSRGGYRRLPVLDDGGDAVGIIKVSHILHFLVEHFPRTIYTLPPSPGPTQAREGA